MGSRKSLLCAALALACSIGFVHPGLAMAGDVFAKGTEYGATTYNNNPGNHPNIFCSPQTSGSNYNVCDINTAADIGNFKGPALYAPEKGTVEVFTRVPSSWGNSIYWISEDGREKLHLAHLFSIEKEGKVDGNELIGYVGNTGNSAGSHLHISREYDGKAAPVILSGETIKPALNKIGLTSGYTSKGSILPGGEPAAAVIPDPQMSITLAAIEQILKMTAWEAAGWLGGNYKEEGTGGEGWLDGYFFPDRKITLSFDGDPTSSAVMAVYCWEGLHIDGVEVGIPIKSVLGIFGEPAKIHLADDYFPLIYVFRLGNLQIDFVSNGGGEDDPTSYAIIDLWR